MEKIKQDGGSRDYRGERERRKVVILYKVIMKGPSDKMTFELSSEGNNGYPGNDYFRSRK